MTERRHPAFCVHGQKKTRNLVFQQHSATSVNGHRIAILPGVERISSTNYELNNFRAMLELRIAELEKLICRRDGIVVEQHSDQLEDIQGASERALSMLNLDRESKQLRNARAALVRIQDGTFGLCEECDEEIPEKRLAAIPWAALCIICEEAADRERTEMGATGDEGWMRRI